MSAVPLDGPRLAPASGQTKKLVVLLHGYGADGNDLLGLAPHWQKLLPDAAFVAPNAPQRCAGSPGYQWFAISRLDARELEEGIAAAAPSLEAFLDAECLKHRIAPERLALVGFSQGTMMALSVGLKRAVRPAAIVGYSGILVGAEHVAPQPEPRPPVLLVHGTADELIPDGMMMQAAMALGAAGLPVQWHRSPGLGHGIDEAGLALGGNFLAAAFSGRLQCPAPAFCLTKK
jgi:phospholipase/carboxylesterase